MAQMSYTDGDGRVYRVFAGLGGGMYKAYVLEWPSGLWCEIPSLPWRTTPEQAEIELWDYAHANGLAARVCGPKVTPPGRAPRHVLPPPRKAQDFGRDRGGVRVVPVPVPLVRAWQILSAEELRRAKRKRQRDHQRELKKADREAARDWDRLRNRKYYDEHREEKRRKSREWWQGRSEDQKERIRAYQRQYYREHKEELARKRYEKKAAEKQAEGKDAGD